jgi:hypothetical protein
MHFLWWLSIGAPFVKSRAILAFILFFPKLLACTRLPHKNLHLVVITTTRGCDFIFLKKNGFESTHYSMFMI